MTTLNWADVVEISHDDYKQSLLEQLDAGGYTVTSWQEGEPALAHVELTAEVGHQTSKLAVYIKEQALVDTASGEALTRLSRSHYDNERDSAQPAQRRITLTCAVGAGPHTFDESDLVVVHPDGPTYRLIDNGDPSVVFPITLVSGGSQPDLIFEAEVAGTGSNKGADTVKALLTTLAGVTITSDLVERSGTDEEADAVLRTRDKTKWALLTEYELIDDAVINICLNATESVTGVVVDSQNPRGAGTFDVWMANDLETASAGDISLAQAAIDARVFGSTATPKTAIVDAAPATPLNITGTVYFKGSYSVADLQAATEAAIIEFIKEIPLGGYDYYPGPSNVVPLNDIESVIREVKVAGQKVSKTVALSLPATDLTVAAFGKVTLGTIAITYTPAV
jgi:hypothetical protein